MKTTIKILAAVLFIAFVSNTSFAQSGTGTCDGTGISSQLHDGSGSGLQGAGNGVMSQIKDKGAVFQSAFRATLTEEQLAIVQNLELTRDEKREALRATFSEAQQEMYNSHMAEVAERQALRGSNALGENQGKAIRSGWKKGRN